MAKRCPRYTTALAQPRPWSGGWADDHAQPSKDPSPSAARRPVGGDGLAVVCGAGLMAGEGDVKYRFGLSFPGQIRLRPTGLGSRLQELLGVQPPVIDFRQTVEQVADRMKAACANNKDMVLYDGYRSGINARPNLDAFLLEEYRGCELVVVFLCKEYADKRWCRLEWQVIQSLVKDPDPRHSVMYLWHGEHDDRVLKDLDLDWERDGFLAIDAMNGEAIWQKVHERYEHDRRAREEHSRITRGEQERNRPVSAEPLVARVPVAETDPVDPCWRLLVLVERTFANEPESKYRASPMLKHGDGRTYSDPEWLNFKSLKLDPVTLETLAGRIALWFQLASNWVDKQDGACTPLVVVLVLPEELLTSRRLGTWLDLVRQCGCTDTAGEDAQAPPILLACTEIHQAALSPAALSPKDRWLTVDTAACNISRAIISRCADPTGQLRDLTWWMYHDEGDHDGPVPADQPDRCGFEGRPRHFAGDEAKGRVHPACDLETPAKRLRVAESGNGEEWPHALLLGWRRDGPQGADQTRLSRILRAGLPLFLLDFKVWANQTSPSGPRPADGEEVLESPTHPFDGILGYSHSGLIRKLCEH
ncbi:MAG: hypothetical protein ACKO45_00935, partial [Cyanobium sp.]